MTKLIAIAIIIIVAVGGWNLYQYWGNYSDDQSQAREQAAAAAAAANFDPHSLPGLPQKLEGQLEIARKRGATGLRDWLNYYRKDIQDPRLAWIELDCCVLLVQNNPVEAKQLFASVKERISPASPVYPRVKQLEKAFE
jgi:hypothetical protein